jgi:hypothetical protein
MNSLPGFDRWLTHNPAEDQPEPTTRHLADARDQLAEEGGEMPTDDEVYALACMLMDEEARASQDDADEHAAESSRDDDDDRYGDGP